MRLCQNGCGEAADLWYHGAWAAKCALRRYGATPALEARFGELHLEVARNDHPSSERPPGNGSLRAVPVLSGAGVVQGPPAAPAPLLTEAELETILEMEHGWVEA